MSIRIENTQVFGWEAAIRGARNPMNSWEKSDSAFLHGSTYYDIFGHMINPIADYDDSSNGGNVIGPNDHKLLMNLCKGGTEEAKWRRMVHVQMDAMAPLYWWKEFETYKVSTVSNSCSTMHKIQAKEFTLDDFSCEHLFHDIEFPLDHEEWCKNNSIDASSIESWEMFSDYLDEYYAEHGVYFNTEFQEVFTAIDPLKFTVEALNFYRTKFLETKDKKYWWQMIQLLPSSYNQKRTIDLNYEVLAAQYRQRKDHKLTEWHQYCDWIKTLPYSEFITMEEDNNAR